MRFVRAGFAAALLLAMLLPAVAVAQTPLQITTPFPSVVADPGGTARFTVTVTTEQPERVDLTTAGTPDTWTTSLRGGGSTISAVYTTAQPIASGEVATTPSAQFQVEVDIPADTQPGPNKVLINGQSASGATASLELDITIETPTAGSVTMTASYPELQGPTSNNFRFELSLHNATAQQINFQLQVDGPVGWTLTAQPTGQSQAATVVTDAGSTTSVQVNAQAPSTTAAGAYPITVTAIGGPDPVQTQLSVKITGSYSMSLTTQDQVLNASVSAGNTTTLNLVVSNSGTAQLTNVAMTATPPQGWTVTFDQPTIAQIDPQVDQPVVATIQPAPDAIAGDYVVSLIARSSDGSSDTVQIRTTVETSALGGLIGIAVLVIVFIGLFFVFQRYGRR